MRRVTAIHGSRVLLQPLFKLAKEHLDVAVAWYLERQRLVVQFLLPGTLLFTFLFFVFSGAGGTAFLLFVFLTIVEALLAAGLYLIQQRYEQYIRQRHEISDAIEALLLKNDIFGEWDNFLGTPYEDSELEEIRVLCQNLPDKYPPQNEDDYCGPDGDHLLEALAGHLRTGYATKFAEDFGRWWNTRRAAKLARKKGGELREAMSATSAAQLDAEQERRRQVADAVQHVPSMQSDTFIEDRSTVEDEAALEVKRAAKESRKDEKRAAKQARKATKKAVKAEKRQAKREAKGHFMPSSMQEPEPEMRPQTKQRPASAGGMTEAQAIELMMREGFTAHHFDKMQHMLLVQFGREPDPMEVIKALRGDRKRVQKAVKKNKVKIPRGRKARRAAKAAVMTQPTRRPSAADFFSEDKPVRDKEPGGAGRFLKIVFVLMLLGGAPFAAWRVPEIDAQTQVLVGEVDHQVIDRAPNWQHQLRTPFEEIWGNKPITLVDGTRIYVTPKDYDLCWPEPWGDMYRQGYTVQITAEAQNLLLGGFTVARIRTAEKVSRPLADGTSDPTRKTQPRERQRSGRTRNASRSR